MITNNTCLQLINIQNNVLQNINTFVLSDNPNLIIIIVGRDRIGNAHDVTLTCFFDNLYIIIDLPYLPLFIPMSYSFSNAISLTLSSILLIDIYIMN